MTAILLGLSLNNQPDHGHCHLNFHLIMDKCPICKENVPEWQLHLHDHFTPFGQWLGPHCSACEKKMQAEVMRTLLADDTATDTLLQSFGVGTLFI